MKSKRLQVELSAQAYEKLQQEAAERNTSLAELVRRALNVDAVLHDKAKEGKLLFRDEEGREQELLLLP